MAMDELKVLVLLAARTGKLEQIEQPLLDATRKLHAAIDGEQVRATAMLSLAKDSFRFSAAPVRAYDATIELRFCAQDAAAQLPGLLEGLADRFDEWAYADLSALLVGEDKAFIDNPPAPIRYQYLMRRRHDFTESQYLKRYADIHSQFGFKTGGIVGYHQFHIDTALSRQACLAAGFGTWDVSSVSELHIEVLDDFLQAVASSNTGEEAAADEELFLDRPNSVMFTSREILNLGY